MNIVRATALSEGVFKSLAYLAENGTKIQGENQNRREEFLDTQLILHVSQPFAWTNLFIPKCLAGGLEDLVKYEEEFLHGTNDGKFEYTYHELYAKYLDDCIDELKRYKYTRRAVLPIAGDASYNTQFPPCLQEMMFRIVPMSKSEDDEVRQISKLNVTAVFRSNDAVKAFPMNAFVICMLMRMVADELEVRTGELLYITNSFHCYEADVNKLYKYTERYYNENLYDLSYSLSEYSEVKDAGI